MTNAKVTDEDRQAAEAAIDEAIRRQDEGEDRGVENAYAQAIANARQAGQEEAAQCLDASADQLHCEWFQAGRHHEAPFIEAAHRQCQKDAIAIRALKEPK